MPIRTKKARTFIPAISIKAGELFRKNHLSVHQVASVEVSNIQQQVIIHTIQNTVFTFAPSEELELVKRNYDREGNFIGFRPARPGELANKSK